MKLEHTEPRDRWIVVTDGVIVAHPCINMYVLISWECPGDLLRNVHVVELLAVHIEDVGIPLCLWDISRHIEVDQARILRKHLQRFHKRELVKIARGDDTCVGVVSQDLGDERGGDVRLCSPLINTLIDRWAGITLDGGATSFRPQMDVDSEEVR